MSESRFTTSVNNELTIITEIIASKLNDTKLFDSSEIDDIIDKIKTEIIIFIEKHGFNILDVGSSDYEIYFDSSTFDVDDKDEICIICNKEKRIIETNLKYLSGNIENELNKFTTNILKMIDTRDNLVKDLIRNIIKLINK